MILHRLLALVSILPFTLACQSAYAAPGGGTPRAPAAGLLPPAKSAIELNVEGGQCPTLAQVLDLVSASTGVTFTAGEQVMGLLERTTCGIRTSASVPADGVWVWSESLLLRAGYSLALLAGDAPHLLAIQARIAGEPQGYLYADVAAEVLDSVADHPALLVRTWVELPHTDVRQLGNNLRALEQVPTDAQSIIPVADSNCVIVSGTGRSVAQLVAMLRATDAASAAAYERRSQEGAPAGGGGSGPPR